MKKIKLGIVLLLLSVTTFAQDITNNKFGKGLYNVVAKDSSYSMKFAIRMQSLFIGEWNVNDSSGVGPGTSQFLVRRARLKFGGFAYHPNLVYKAELGLTNRDISGASSHTKNAPRLILDAVVKWKFYKNFSLWVGQTKLPGNRERVISSGNLQFVDRSLVNSRFNIDRDMGFQLHHHFKIGSNFLIREKVSLSQGEGRNITSQNLGGYQYTGRIEILPFGKFASKGDYIGSDLKREKKPKLSLAATYDHHDRAVKNRSNLGSYMVNDVGFFETDINTLFIDAMFKFKGISFMAEYADRTAGQAIAVNSDGTETGDVVNIGTGYVFQAGYLLKNNWELAARYTAIDLDKVTGKDLEQQYTFGLSKYVVGHKLKVQSDISYLTIEGSSDSELMYRLQVDIHL